jgi:hypothetical protein
MYQKGGFRTPLLVKEGLGEVVIMGRAPKRDFGLYPTLPPLTKGRNENYRTPLLVKEGLGEVVITGFAPRKYLSLLPRYLLVTEGEVDFFALPEPVE